MDNFCRGDGRRLGKALPQHKLMQNLLMRDFGKKQIVKVTQGTQTEFKKSVSETTCCCQRQSQQNWKSKSVRKINEELQSRRMNQNYQRLLASIRDRVVAKQDEERCCCSCSDTWSNSSAGNGDTIHFPKETRNAMTLLLMESRHRRPPSKPMSRPIRPCGWPGMAERMDHDEEKQLINADEIAAKIASKLSKNKLDRN